jgi:hypothetical protein
MTKTKTKSSHSAADAGAATVELRTSWARIAALALIGPASAASGFLLAFETGDHAGRHGVPTGLLVAVVVYFAVLSAISAWLQRRNCVVLRTGELTVRSGLRAHVMRARDVQAVTLERFLGSRTVKVWLADGSYHRAAVAGRTRGLFRQNFDGDYHLIGDWWLANRGANWQPTPATRHAPVPLDFNWNPLA